VIYEAQLREVLILDSYGPLRRPRKDIFDAALFRSGRPLILVPQTTLEFVTRKITIAWDATRSAVRAVRDALPVLKQAQNVTVLSIVDDKAFSTRHKGDALCRYLARWNVAATFSTVARGKLDVGTVLLTYARRTNADLLVMGGFAHAFERELMLGSATRDVYHTSIELPVFLSH
jgi:nucleotide-binding universal stress UspA family protein